MKILACTDGSETGMKAIEMAAKVASWEEGSEVTAIFVHKPIQTMPTHGYVPHHYGERTERVEIPQKVRDDLLSQGEHMLDKAGEILEAKNVTYRTQLKEGHPAAAIVAYAQEKDIDLILIGDRGHSKLKRVLLGSVSSAVVQEASCHVMVVKDKK